MASNYVPTVLTIAGSDPYAGAGIQIDSKSIHKIGGYAFTVITALTSQNSTGVKAIYPIPAKTLNDQILAILDDIKPDAIKIGMLGTAEAVEVITNIIIEYKLSNIVLDPIITSSSGARLLSENGVALMREKLFPIVDLITPNIPEYQIFTNRELEIEHIDFDNLDMMQAKALLIKGGHSNESDSIDYLIKNETVTAFASPRVKTTHTHGTGCILSSAIATHLAHGKSIEESIKLAKDFLYKNISKCDMTFKYNTPVKNKKEPIY